MDVGTANPIVARLGLGLHAGVGRTVLTAILNGNTTHISTDRLIDIAQNLGLTVSLRVA